MITRIVEARYVDDYVVWIKFNDGSCGDVDLKEELWGPMFEPLKDRNFFQRLRVHPELNTIVWDNGADFSPEFLLRSLRATT